MSSLSERYFALKADLKEVELVAVSKQATLEQIEALYELGQRDFAENRVDQLLERAELLEQQGLTSLRWHFIGNLQSNKIKKLLKIKNLYAIHSVDRLDILDKILKSDRIVRLFLQIKTSPEMEKAGFTDINEIQMAISRIQKSQSYFEGFMTMAPIRGELLEEEARHCFKALKDLREKLAPVARLSMGMSDDYCIALEWGADVVRLGSVLFQE